jgi:DNA-binding GntR family transcriptional regulator
LEARAHDANRADGGWRERFASYVPPGAWSPDLRKSKVYEQILLDILVGALPPDARLDEQDLALAYGAGLAGVREALGRLALEGLVVRRPRAGTTVAPLDLMEMQETFEARRLIEPHCAALAAENATAEDVAELARVIDEGETAANEGDHRALVVAGQSYRAALVSAGGNLTLGRILLPLQCKVARFWAWSMTHDLRPRFGDHIAQGRAVVARIAAGDPSGAHRAALRALVGQADDLRRIARGEATARGAAV